MKSGRKKTDKTIGKINKSKKYQKESGRTGNTEKKTI